LQPGCIRAEMRADATEQAAEDAALAVATKDA